MNSRRNVLMVGLLATALILVFGSFHSALAQTAPSLGSARTFAALGGTEVTCTNSNVTGNLGVFPGITFTETKCPVIGTTNVGDTVAEQAHHDLDIAYDEFMALPCDQALTTLDGQALLPGVYCFDGAATSTNGVLTLDGPPDGIWIFKIGILGTGALTGTNFSVLMPGGDTCNNNVFWWTAKAATMTDSVFLGSILAGTSITFTGGSLDGQALAAAAVTLTNTSVCTQSASSLPRRT